MAFSDTNDSTHINLKKLDEYISNKTEYENIKKQTLASLISQLDNDVSTEKQYEIYNKLFSEYQTYNFDSAYYCTERMVDLAKKLDNAIKETDSYLLMSYCTISAGLYLESNEILAKIDTGELTNDQKIFMYTIYAKLYLDMADALEIKQYTRSYLKNSIMYNEKVINLLGKDNTNSLPHIANIHRCRYEYDEAIATLKTYMENAKLDKRGRTLCLGSIGQSYLCKKDTTNAINYLIETAISDIEFVTKETPSLSILAGILYKRGDIERSYTYARSSLEDANFYNARHRKIEVGDVLPIIEASRFDVIEKQKDTFLKYSILVSILIIIACIALLVIWKQIKQLREARRVIQKQNVNLHHINDKLIEVNKIKDEYIGSFFTANFALIDKVEEFQKVLSRKITGRQFNDLGQVVNKLNMRKERELSLISFDQIFLKIFPDFIKDFNDLFDDEHKIKLYNQEEMTTEIRIFALIRLGVSDSDRIAKLLDYSVNTINTYKTKVKNRSFIPNDQFEAKIMEIGFGENE